MSRRKERTREKKGKEQGKYMKKKKLRAKKINRLIAEKGENKRKSIFNEIESQKGIFSKKKTNPLTTEKENKKREEKEIRKVIGNINNEENKKRRISLLKFYLKRTNIEIPPMRIKRRIFFINLIVTAFLSILLLIQLIRIHSTVWNALLLTVVLWTVGFAMILIIIWLGFFFYLDMLMYNRKVKVESVLSDFLQLTSANVRAGMPIDRALWYAVRPRFGILAKEIEEVAKETMTGEPLEKALREFSEKYDSKLLKDSITLLVEGLDAGGEVGDLLNRISKNIQETQILRKEMAANVMTYVIFISFATLFAAPFLMGLSYQLLTVINKISSQLATTGIPKSGMFNFGFAEGGGIKPVDFKIFAISMLGVTSAFSSMIITTIQKGNIKSGIKNIPVFIIISIALFLMLAGALGSLFGSII